MNKGVVVPPSLACNATNLDVGDRRDVGRHANARVQPQGVILGQGLLLKDVEQAAAHVATMQRLEKRTGVYVRSTSAINYNSTTREP